MAVHVFARWLVKQGQLGAVLELLPAVVRASLDEAGNLFYQVHQDTADLRTLILFEGYADEAALAEHRSSSHFQAIVVGQIVPLLESREVVLATPLHL
jgi:(4S)-4-hydroxy-5-phosphonooxypentane-2,3-dione isomerase